jgi:molybdenum cofactor synthesis domain-containing protein
MRAGVITLSDKGSRGQRVDASGPAVSEWLAKRGVSIVRTLVLADDEQSIVQTLAAWADSREMDLIVTTGGTGVSPRDVTPEATLKVVSRVLPGFGEAMRAASLKKTPHAVISRAQAGVRGLTLIINLPGSPRAALENLEVVWAAVPHAVTKIQGDLTDCGPTNGEP